MAGFGLAGRLGHLEHHATALGDQPRIPDIGSVDHSVYRRGDLDRAAKAGQQLTERLVLRQEQPGIRLPPRRGGEVAHRGGPPDKHPAQWQAHRTDAIPQAGPICVRAGSHAITSHRTVRSGSSQRVTLAPGRGRARTARRRQG